MIPVETTIAGVRQVVAAARAAGRSVGFVPTMGALHAGHAHLVECCRAAAGLVVVSVFVNPTQFGPNEDFQRYPRTLHDDVALSAQAGADVVFAPAVQEMYPDGQLSTYVEVPGLSRVLEGASRPGHFRGVATVVLKLFEIVRPDVAFFGQKDFQQQLVIKRMVADLDLPVTIQAVPTVREPDGLAMSSRNRYLGPEERSAATVLSRALAEARTAVRGGERDASRVRQILAQTVESERLARLDYAEVADAATLEHLDTLDPGRGAVALLAVRIGATRLIDNAILTDD
jgi:pantoate--beta-alanine ligase